MRALIFAVLLLLPSVAAIAEWRLTVFPPGFPTGKGTELVYVIQDHEKTFKVPKLPKGISCEVEGSFGGYSMTILCVADKGASARVVIAGDQFTDPEPHGQLIFTSGDARAILQIRRLK